MSLYLITCDSILGCTAYQIINANLTFTANNQQPSISTVHTNPGKYLDFIKKFITYYLFSHQILTVSLLLP